MNKVVKFFGSPWGQRVILLIIVILIMAIFQPKFFSLDNVSSILLAIAIYGIMVCGMLYVVILGGIDLSIASAAALGGSILSVIAKGSGYTVEGFITGFVVAIVVAILVGLLHGIMNTVFGLPSFVVTLATQYILLGAVLIVTKGAYIYHSDYGIFYMLGNARPLNIPLPVIIFLIYVAISAFILGCTTYGRRLYCIGGNPIASGLVGIKTKRDTIIAYVICSVSAFFGGMILVSMNMMAGAATASGAVGSVLTAIIVGGINLAGGEGGIPGAIFGALLVGIINNALILLGVPSDYQKFVQGVIIIGAIALSVYTGRRSENIKTPTTKKPTKKALDNAQSAEI
ncbi:MAG: ABC transporter permease [Peptococcaceae bacterium]|nr:ABC transporter permease [Peptococcaceae bacterium]